MKNRTGIAKVEGSGTPSRLAPMPAKSLVDPVRFVQATRDSGYRNMEAALCEIIDNALQASARHIRVFTPENAHNLGRDHYGEPFVAVLDNGHGMTPDQLQIALQFGGSHRFNDRGGLGRFGMGLPNSSLSQGRRLDVYTWQNSGPIWHSYLDLDDIIANGDTSSNLAPPATVPLLPPIRSRGGRRSSSGTLVIWSRLDRAQHLRWASVVRSLDRRLGQVFRYFLWDRRKIFLDNSPVRPVDPLFLSTDTNGMLARAYGEPLYYQVTPACIEGNTTLAKDAATITVRFSELPVSDLTDLPSAEKRRLGVVGGAGVSIVRAGREIAFGWYLMDKRRENYDDWWRCEISFPPELDEAFGVTHTKQGIRPTEQLRRIMQPELGSIARTLNRRVRLAHLEIAQERARVGTAIVTAGRRDAFLPPLLPMPVPMSVKQVPRFVLRTEELDDSAFCRARVEPDGQVVITINEGHEFYRAIYHPLVQAEQIGSDEARRFRRQMELLLLALGRSQCLERAAADTAAIERFVGEWSRTLAVYCGGGGTFYDLHDGFTA